MLRGLIEFVDECGVRPAMIAAIVHAVDEQVATMLLARDELAVAVGIGRHECMALICSSRWGKKTAAGTEAGRTR